MTLASLNIYIISFQKFTPMINISCCQTHSHIILLDFIIIIFAELCVNSLSCGMSILIPQDWVKFPRISHNTLCLFILQYFSHSIHSFKFTCLNYHQIECFIQVQNLLCLSKILQSRAKFMVHNKYSKVIIKFKDFFPIIYMCICRMHTNN